MTTNYGIDTGRLIAGRTWIEEKEVPQIIVDFLESEYSTAHYEAMAKMVEENLRTRLEAGGVTKFKLSRRAKNHESLKEKLIIRNRNRKIDYQSFQEIKKDIVDLAGVRVILYMPTQEDNHKVKEVIQKEWGKDIMPRIHPPPRNIAETQRDEPEFEKITEYRPLHLGYRAVHYVVPMREKDKGKYYKWLKDDKIEIQVVSALTHAWAEVGHDILYKTLADGRPSLEEERILDALNGLIQSGDLLLQQFQQMYMTRRSLPFVHREDLMNFLRRFLSPNNIDYDLEAAPFPRDEGILILLKFLQMENMNTPRQILPELEKLGYPFHHRAKEDLIRKSFAPVPKLAPKMSLVICFIRHLLHDRSYEASVEPRNVAEMCAIMMSTLTTLDYCLGGPEEAKAHLQRLAMTDQQKLNMDFLLEKNPKRYVTLAGELDHGEMARESLQDAWEWFRLSACDSRSFCGFIFRLTEMGCRKEVDPRTQIQQLQIEPLSRSNSSGLD